MQKKKMGSEKKKVICKLRPNTEEHKYMANGFNAKNYEERNQGCSYRNQILKLELGLIFPSYCLYWTSHTTTLGSRI